MKNAWLFLAVLLITSSLANAQYTWTTNSNGTLTITSYTGAGGAVTVPVTLSGRNVTVIGDSALPILKRARLTVVPV
jgi:hypothetical protein